jgi:Fe-Mn family superoxide dismutase
LLLYDRELASGMNSDTSAGLSRRDALKTMGAAAALLSLATVSKRVLAADSLAGGGSAGTGPAGSTSQPFTLPALDFGYDALEPHIDRQTMEIHHTKHHQAYITNANKALADYPELKTKTAEALLSELSAVPEKIRAAVRNNVGGHVNHSFFWKTLAPQAGGEPAGELAAAISKGFGSFEAFKAQFTAAAMARFGSGWAWLCTQDGQLKISSTPNQDSPLSEGATPLLGIDVWEHAYYLHYQNRRADYVTAFWKVVNWAQVTQNYQAAKSA